METKTSIVLAKNGDCCVTVIDGIYKVLVRIDDKGLQTMFALKVQAVLECIDAQLQESGEAWVNLIPKDTYRHIPVVCAEDYGLSLDEVDEVKFFLEDGYKALSDAAGFMPEPDEMIINIVTLSSFLEFRKTTLGLETFPNIQFALPDSAEQEKKLLNGAETLRNVLKRDIGQA